MIYDEHVKLSTYKSALHVRKCSKQANPEQTTIKSSNRYMLTPEVLVYEKARMEPQALADMELEGNILLWNSPRHRYSSDRVKGNSPSETQSFFPPLFWNELEDIKHSDYTAHLLIQKQTRDYAFAVEDVLLLLKNASTEFLRGLETWRGADYETLDSDDLSQYGNKVLSLSTAIKKLQEENTFLLWTSGQRDDILKLLVSLAKDTVKLRRKLFRIRDTLGDRVKNVRKVAMKCECEVNHAQNLVPAEIYFQWMKEDAQFLTSNIPKSYMDESLKSKSTIDGMKGTMLNVMSCGQQESSAELEMATSVSEVSIASSSTSKNVPAKMYYQMRKDIEVLHRDHLTAEDSVYEGSLSDIRKSPATCLKIHFNVDESDSVTDASGTPKVSKKYLQEIASNVSLPKIVMPMDCIYNKPNYQPSDDSYTDSMVDSSGANCFFNLNEPEQIIPSDKSNIGPSSVDNDQDDMHVVPTKNQNDLVQVFLPSEQEAVQKEADLCIAINPQQEENETVASAPTENDLLESPAVLPSVLPLCNEQKCNSDISADGKPDRDKPRDSQDNELASSVLDSKKLEMPPTLQEFIVALPNSSTSNTAKSLSSSMSKELTFIKSTKMDLQDTVFRTMQIVREVESSWYNPPPNMRSTNKKLKELYQLVDFIVETAKLTNNPAFASRLYKEDKQEIISVLDPVFRELTSCYVKLYELCSIVTVDASYLKELLSRIPKGNLVIREWISDPAIDAECNGEDKPLEDDFDVDVDELFA